MLKKRERVFLLFPRCKNLFFAILFSLLSTNSYASTNSVIIKVKPGDTLLGILQNADISTNDAINAIDKLSKLYNPGHLKIGQKIKVNFDINDKNQKHIFNSLHIKVSKIKEIKINRDNDGNFLVKEIISPTQTKLIKADGQIDATLFEAINRANIPYSVREKFIKNYSYDVDFQREIRKGNSFEVLYEALFTEDDEFVSGGNIVYSSLKIGDRDLSMYRYTDSNGNTDYYDADGNTIQKSLLKTPVDGARISSGFGRRKHPILGYSRMHQGLDFAAPTGTPVYAAGKGVIVEIRHKGSYGNYIKVRHNNGYSTAYAHLKKFARGLRKGSKIDQGQVIAYVGTTGRSTGPHLHYEVIENGRQINPLSVRTAARSQLKDVKLGIFKQYAQHVERLLDKMDTQNKLAASR